MAIEIRTIEAGEERAFVEAVCVPFLDHPTDAIMEGALAEHEADRCVVAVDGGRMVASAAALTLDVSVPGPAGRPCPAAAMAGVTSVGVHPTHRRRGILRRLMAALLDQARERREPLAGLTASEGAIYGRFGFGVAVERASVRVDTATFRFTVPPPAADLTLLGPDEAADALPGLLDRARRARPGEVSRPAGSWTLRWREDWRCDDKPPFVAAGQRGYVAYRVVPTRVHGFQRATIEVLDLVGEDDEAEAGLWAYVAGIDLATEVTARHRSPAEAVRWRLADPRAWQVTQLTDNLWLRVLDVPAALEGRAYPVAGDLVLDVAPPAGAERDRVAGRWHLECGPEGAAVRPAKDGEPTDLRLGVADLGALYLGGVAASTLTAAGRVVEERPGAAGFADRLLASPVAPRNSTGF